MSGTALVKVLAGKPKTFFRPPNPLQSLKTSYYKSFITWIKKWILNNNAYPHHYFRILSKNSKSGFIGLTQISVFVHTAISIHVLLIAISVFNFIIKTMFNDCTAALSLTVWIVIDCTATQLKYMDSYQHFIIYCMTNYYPRQ